MKVVWSVPPRFGMKISHDLLFSSATVTLVDVPLPPLMTGQAVHLVVELTLRSVATVTGLASGSLMEAVEVS